MRQSCHWEHMSNPRPSWSCSRAVSMAAEERWAMLPQASHPSSPSTSTLGNIFPHCLVLVLEEKLHAQSQQTPQVLFHQPLANCGCSLDAHLHKYHPLAGKGPSRDIEKEAGQTHQLFEEGSFLVLLRIALILVQAILQLQCECVIVGSYYLQHLGKVKGQAGLRPNSRSLGPHTPPTALVGWIQSGATPPEVILIHNLSSRKKSGPRE